MKLLLIEDNPGDVRLMREALRESASMAFVVDTAGRLDDGLAQLSAARHELVLLDLSLPDSQGMETLRTLRAAAPDVPIVVLTGMDDEGLATEAVREGAQDYLVKGQLDGPLIQRAIRYAVERQRAMASLRQALVAADAANRAKSAFLAGMSHELRTPLNAIIGFSAAICDEIAGPVEPPTYREYAGYVQESGQNLLTLINNVLAVSQAETLGFTQSTKRIDPAVLIDQCVGDLRRAAAVQKVTVERALPDRLPSVLGHETALTQALAALLSNAVKFNNPGGRVVVAAQCLTGGGFAIQVSDTGIGIAPENLANAFRPFAGLGESLTRRHEGIGLGLAVAKRIIEAHGGRLEIDSTPGVGTTVALILPPERVQHAPEPPSLAIPA
jgi:signal transduction histidine kinase